ncbi:MarR family transcriptional regulator [Kitasatospora acidiphila]|uniref:MarR family transcriptional regulator n=1 Tax=Kitasatospora acidiphila TaxID=2567942 RepID=A0A540W398_9ACTN|nr:transcriptional regulator [Kitasatospora acidiphila]TQF03501.1 MarR family transcriptional regulator [Kitasatospora acidiphila]
MSGPRVDEVIHHPTRLALVGFLSGCHEAEFGAVRDYCGISDASVSRIVSALEEAGYVKVRKGYVGKRPRTWLALTAAGRTALADHLAALQAIVDSAARAAGQPPQA